MKKLLIALMITAMLLVPVVIAENSKDKAKANDPREPLDKIIFIHYKDGTAKQVGGAAKSPTCYSLMGIKWGSLPVSYVINPTNPHGLSESFVISAISTSAETWDAKTSKELFNNVYTTNYFATYGVQNYQNAIIFGDYPSDNVIAVTSIWYTTRGKQIVEFDIMFNTRFTWGDAAVNSAKMDLQNIATHELGHAVGLNDIYTTSCSAVTMYGYGSYGETQKRTLEQPDITGLQKLYGA